MDEGELIMGQVFSTQYVHGIHNASGATGGSLSRAQVRIPRAPEEGAPPFCVDLPIRAINQMCFTAPASVATRKTTTTAFVWI